MALSSTLVSLGTLVAIYGLLSLGLNLKFGYNGLLDIGHVAFFLVGAYVATLLVLEPAANREFIDYVLGLNWPWLPAIAVGTVAAGIFGMLVALPAIRLREDYLAIAVLGLSVIAKRIVQTETWLANGPDALHGWESPLGGLFPLPPSGSLLADPSVDAAAGVVLFGAVVFALYAVGTYVLAGLEAVVEPSNPYGWNDRIRDGLLAITSGGIGYLAARSTHRREDLRPRDAALGVGALAGLLGAGTAAVGLGTLAALALLGLFSLFSLVLGGVVVARYYGDIPRADAAIALGLAVAFVAVFAPVVFLGGAGPGARDLSVVATLVLLAGFLYGGYYLGSNWDRFGHGSPFISVIGVMAVWLVAIRYFVLATVGALAARGPTAAVNELIQNLLWLLEFGARVQFGYSRFFFVVTVAVLAGAYLLLERTVTSPFGRVLKAIREDEDVAMALGKDTFSFKVQSMVLGSALAGLAGALFAIHQQAISHLVFEPRVTFIVFLMVIIGGAANNRGAILGAAIFWAFQKATADLAGFFPTAERAQVQALRLAFLGALLIVILYYRPQGIWGERQMVSMEAEE